jgi:hypothetical protein
MRKPPSITTQIIARLLSFAIACLIVFGILSLCSCNPCKRIVKHHPDCFNNGVITVHDTLRIPGAKADTVFRSSTTKDTIVLQKDRLTVKYYNSNDTVFLSGNCQDSVITREIRVPVTIQKYNKLTDAGAIWAWSGLIGAIALFLFIIRKKH